MQCNRLFFFYFVSYILIQEGTSLEHYLENLSGQERPQPFILLMGGRRWSPMQTFVIIERKAVPCSSVIAAIDTCFKLTYILDLEYQPQCSGAWQVLQHLVDEVPPGSLSGVALVNFRSWLSIDSPWYLDQKKFDQALFFWPCWRSENGHQPPRLVDRIKSGRKSFRLSHICLLITDFCHESIAYDYVLQLNLRLLRYRLPACPFPVCIVPGV